MKTMQSLAAALVLMALAALPAAARAQQTPEQVAGRYLQTLKAQDWAANATLMDPAELDSMKAAFIDVATADTSTAGLRAIFRVASAAELRQLDPSTVYQRFVANVIGQRQGMAQMLAAATFHVVGHVQEADSAYVVYRVTTTVPNGPPVSQVTVLALRRVGGTWKAQLNEEIRGMLMGLRQAAAQRRASTAAGQARPNPVPAAPTAPPAAPPPATPTRP